MMKIIKYTFYIIVVVSTVYFALYLKESEKQKNMIVSELLLKNNEIKDIKRLDSLELINSFKILKNIQFKNEEKKSVFLRDQLNGGWTLIYRYFDINCQVCVISTLESLNKLLWDKSKLKVIGSYQSHRDLLQFKRMNNIKTDISNIGNENLVKSLDVLETPYLLLVDKNLKIKSVHILSKDFLNRSDLYVKSMSELLNNMNKNMQF